MKVGHLRHLLTLENPDAPVADGDGSFTTTWTELSPSPVSAEIMPATARNLERTVSGTVQAVATHVVRIRYHPDVTTKTRLTKGPRDDDGTLSSGSREFSVTGIVNPYERNIELLLTCVEDLS